MPKAKKVPGKSLDDLAKELGYTPGEFTLRRLVEDIQAVKTWREDYVRTGKMPPDLNMDPADFRGFMLDSEVELAKREAALLDYFHPKKKAVEHKGSESGGAFKFIIEG